jgi:hypothetical protein
MKKTDASLAKLGLTVPRTIAVGLLVGLAAPLFLRAARKMKLTGLDVESNLGAVFVKEEGRKRDLAGLAMSAVITALVTLVGRQILNSKHRSRTEDGLYLGFMNWLLAGVFFGQMARLQKFAKGPIPQRPGYFAIREGWKTVLGSAVSHLGYGAFLAHISGHKQFLNAQLKARREGRPLQHTQEGHIAASMG